TAGHPPYTWSLPGCDLEAWIDDLLCECHLAVDDPHAGLAAARHAHAVSPDSHRAGRIAWILCEYFPEHQEEAFERAHREGAHGGFEAVKQKPGYADYVRRLEKAQRCKTDWRWRARSRPISETALREAEETLGAALPADYRRFLAAKGPAPRVPRRGAAHVRGSPQAAALRGRGPARRPPRRPLRVSHAARLQRAVILPQGVRRGVARPRARGGARRRERLHAGPSGSRRAFRLVLPVAP